MREKIRILSVGLALWLLPLSTSVNAFSSLFVFGDSLSDTGNAFLATGEIQEVPFGGLVPNNAYSSGRLSNGPVWVEYLADDMGLSAEPFLGGGTNFAFGGALTGPQPTLPESASPSLLEQLGLSQIGDVSPDALYIVYGGGNDARGAAQQMMGGQEAQASATVEQGVTNLTQIVGFLASSGATNFLIPNLPDLGLTPEATRGPVGLAEASTTVSTEFNALLEQALLAFQSDPTLNFTEVDTFEFTRNIIDSPENFGLPASFNTTEPCIEPASVCDNPDERFFYDGIHPTTVGHREFAQVASQQLQPVPEPSTLVGSLAVGLAAIWRRRKQRLS